MNNKDLKNRFGIFFRIKHRIYSEFFYYVKHKCISGHTMIDVYIGSLSISVIYKF